MYTRGYPNHLYIYSTLKLLFQSIIDHIWGIHVLNNRKLDSVNKSSSYPLVYKHGVLLTLISLHTGHNEYVQHGEKFTLSILKWNSVSHILLCLQNTFIVKYPKSKQNLPVQRENVVHFFCSVHWIIGQNLCAFYIMFAKLFLMEEKYSTVTTH